MKWRRSAFRIVAIALTGLGVAMHLFGSAGLWEDPVPLGSLGAMAYFLAAWISASPADLRTRLLSALLCTGLSLLAVMCVLAPHAMASTPAGWLSRSLGEIALHASTAVSVGIVVGACADAAHALRVQGRDSAGPTVRGKVAPAIALE